MLKIVLIIKTGWLVVLASQIWTFRKLPKMFMDKNIGMKKRKLSIDFIQKAWRNMLKADVCTATKHKIILLWPKPWVIIFLFSLTSFSFEFLHSFFKQVCFEKKLLTHCWFSSIWCPFHSLYMQIYHLNACKLIVGKGGHTSPFLRFPLSRNPGCLHLL